MSYLSYMYIKDKKVVSVVYVWIRLRLTTAYLLCSQEFRQNKCTCASILMLLQCTHPSPRSRALDVSYENLSQLFCLNSLAKVNTQLHVLICNYYCYESLNQIMRCWSTACLLSRGGFLVQSKGLFGDVPLKSVSKSAFWYKNCPLIQCKTGINMGHIFKIF